MGCTCHTANRDEIQQGPADESCTDRDLSMALDRRLAQGGITVSLPTQARARRWHHTDVVGATVEIKSPILLRCEDRERRGRHDQVREYDGEKRSNSHKFKQVSSLLFKQCM